MCTSRLHQCQSKEDREREGEDGKRNGTRMPWEEGTVLGRDTMAQFASLHNLNAPHAADSSQTWWPRLSTCSERQREGERLC